MFLLDYDWCILWKSCHVILSSQEDVYVCVPQYTYCECYVCNIWRFKASNSRLQVSFKKASLFICPIRRAFHGLVIKLVTNTNIFWSFQVLGEWNVRPHSKHAHNSNCKQPRTPVQKFPALCISLLYRQADVCLTMGRFLCTCLSE